jgi:Hydrogenase maturation factor
MTEDESSLEDIRYGSEGFQYPSEEHDTAAEQVACDLENAVKTAQWLSRLIFSARTDRVQHLYVSVALGLLKNELDLREVADHFHVTRERVAQVVKKVKGFEISERP